MIFVMNEKKYAERIINGNDYGDRKNFLYTTNVIAKYYKSLGYEKNEIRNILKEIIKEKNVQAKDESINFWIKKSLEVSDNHDLYEIDRIEITNQEMERIKSIHSEKFKDFRIQKFAFTLLCLAKFGKSRGIKDNWVNIPQKNIFVIANIKGETIDTQYSLIYELLKSGYIEVNPRIEKQGIKVLGVIDGETEIVVEDINEAGLVYESKICGKKFTRCQKCNKMIPVINNRCLYCRECAVEIDREKARERMRKIGVLT